MADGCGQEHTRRLKGSVGVRCRSGGQSDLAMHARPRASTSCQAPRPARRFVSEAGERERERASNIARPLPLPESHGLERCFVANSFARRRSPRASGQRGDGHSRLDACGGRSRTSAPRVEVAADLAPGTAGQSAPGKGLGCQLGVRMPTMRPWAQSGGRHAWCKPWPMSARHCRRRAGHWMWKARAAARSPSCGSARPFSFLFGGIGALDAVYASEQHISHRPVEGCIVVSSEYIRQVSCCDVFST